MIAKSELLHCRSCGSVAFDDDHYLAIDEKQYCPDCQPPPIADRPAVPLTNLAIRPALAAAENALRRLGAMGRAQALHFRFNDAAMKSDRRQGWRIILEYVKDDPRPSNA